MLLLGVFIVGLSPIKQIAQDYEEYAVGILPPPLIRP